MKRVLGALGVVISVLPACGGSGESPPTTVATSTTTTTAVTPTTAAPTTTSSEPASPVEPADVIFAGGVILTMDPAQPTVEALALRGGRIVAVGTDREVLPLNGPGTRLIFLHGLTVMPGFVDAHSHILNEGAYGETLEERQAAALRNGITTLGNLYTDEGFLAAMREFDAAGLLRVRTSLYLIYNFACGDPHGEWYLDIPPTREAGEMLRIGGVKVYADGGSCNPVSLSVQFTPGGALVDPYVTVDELIGVIQRAQAVGHQMAIHALGDRALDVALDSVEAALDGAPNTYRHRIEHNSVVRPDQYHRYTEVGVVATIFADYPSCAPFAAPLPEYADWEWPYDEIIAANPDVHFAWHGDAPYFSINPLHQLFGFVTRYDVAEDGSVCPPVEWLADDTIPVGDALRLMTFESAYALFREEEVGTLRVGLLADLIILSANPEVVDPFAIKDIAVLMTMVGGTVEYCAPDNDDLCP